MLLNSHFITRVTTSIAIGLAFLTALAVPIVYYTVFYKHIAGESDVEA